MKTIKIEIRRNQDITFSCVCTNPESLKGLLSEEDRIKSRVLMRIQGDLEEELWHAIEADSPNDLSGNPITRETHEVGFDIEVVDGVAYPSNAWVRPKKSEYAQ